MSTTPLFVVQQVAPVFASLVIASIWRGALLAAVVALGLKCLPGFSAAVRSAIWFCVLLVVIASPALSLFGASHTGVASTGLLHVDIRWSYALLAVWAAFSCFRLAQLAVSGTQLRGLARRGIAHEPSEAIADILRSTPRRVQLCVSTEVDRPSVVGFFQPRILFPPALLATLSETELEQVVLHELEHLRRYDDWTNLLQKVAVALLPLHPVVVWLDRRLSLERELACDDGVVRATQARKSYAACLTSLAEHSLMRRGVSLALGALGDWKPKSEVARRVCRILAKPEAAMGRVQARFAAGSVLAGVLGGAVVLAHAPHLVSFAPEVATSAMAAETATSTFAAQPRAVAASMNLNSSATPRAVFASAIVKSEAPSRMVKAAMPLAKRRKLAMKHARAFAQQPVQQADPLFRLAAWHDDEMSAPRLALAIQQDSQFAYAAVPVRGGWLIVQL